MIGSIYPAPVVGDEAGPEVAHHVHRQLQGENGDEASVQLRNTDKTNQSSC
jgi:hypothetical protein